MHPEWEYDIIPIEGSRAYDKPLIEVFDQVGRDGWELVAVKERKAFFKRRVLTGADQ